MKKLYSIIPIILVIITISVCGCSSATATTTPMPTYNPPTSTTPAATVYTGTPNLTFNSAATETIPPDGVYLQPGQTITVSWSADGDLTGYVFSSNQYANWQQSHLVVTSDASAYYSTYSYSYPVQDADTYYLVLYDGNSFGSNSINDYNFTITISPPTSATATTTFLQTTTPPAFVTTLTYKEKEPPIRERT